MAKRARLARTPSKVKAELQRRGMWREFTARQSRLRNSDRNQKALLSTLVGEYLGPRWAEGPKYWTKIDPHDIPPGNEYSLDALDSPAAQSKTAKVERLNIRRDVSWVLSNLLTEGLYEKDAPSRIAYVLWAVYSKDKKMQKAFMEKFAIRLLPTQAQLDKKEQFADTGDKCTDAIAAALKFADSGATENIISVLSPRPEGLPEESGVQGQDGEIRKAE